MSKYEPTPEERRIIEEFEKTREARSKMPATPPSQPDKYSFPLGLDDNLNPFPVSRRKPSTPSEPPPVQDQEWDGTTQRTTYREDEVARRDQVADAARDGQWPRLFELLATGGGVNKTRLTSKEGYTPLHQAAWHGAPVDVAQRLIQLGAWRTLRTYAGKTARDIAQERGHQHLLDILQPIIRHKVADNVLRGLERQLHLLIRGRSAELVLKGQLRLPELAPITELIEPKLWFPVPGQYGGFSIELHGEELKVSSWNRVVGGWAQTHRITRDTIQLIDEGWDLPKPQ
jgi:hypothetical protein